MTKGKLVQKQAKFERNIKTLSYVFFHM